MTLSMACHVEEYQLLRIEGNFAALEGGEVFGTIDLKDAYNQQPLDKAASMLTVVNTQKGLFTFSRLPLGVVSAPAFCQRCIQAVLQGLPGVQVYLDIIVTENQNDSSLLQAVLQRL